MEIRGSRVTWGDGEAQNMHHVWLWMWGVGKDTTQHRKAVVRFGGLIMTQIYRYSSSKIDFL